MKSPISLILCIALPALVHAENPVTADWPRLLGPAHNCTTPESGLLRKFPEGGPKIVWEAPLGNGFGGPAIAGKRLVIFHRLGEKEVVECRDAGSGAPLWRFDYDAPYRPRYGGSSGPRTSPVIAEGHVFTFGISGRLHCLDLASGNVIWQHDCAREFAMGPVFFGYGSSPLVMGRRVIVQLGGKHGDKPANTAAFDTATGKLLWAAAHEWGPSYASPVPAVLHGRECVLVFAGGQSRPATGGLLILDAADGAVLSAVAHRAEIAESVNASSPVVVSAEPGRPARVLVSEAYSAGGLCVEVAKDFSTKAAWRAENFALYWMTPLVRDGCVYGFSGLSDRLSELVCHEAASGRELWRSNLEGVFGRGSLLATGDGVLCLGEFGELAWLELTPKGARVLERCTLFEAPETWTLPALSGGLLYVQQNEPGRGGTKPRLVCYDLRAR
jgi:outer membrane protein assembly factor BamB